MPASTTSPVLAVLLPLLAAGVLTATAWVAGRLVTWRLIPERAPERIPLSLALGFAVLANLAQLLGLLGAFRPGLWIAVLVVIHLLGIGCWRELVGGGLPRPRGRVPLILLLGVLPLAVLAFYPPTAFDATMYHLPYAKAFVQTGGMPFLPDLRYPIFPQLDELLLAGTFLLGGGDSGANLVHLVLTLATAALVWGWGRQAFSPEGGWLAAAIFLGSPLIVGLAVTGYVEATLALFTTSALYAVWRWRMSSRLGWLVLAGAFAASAAGVKYLGIFFVLLLLVEAAFAAWRDRALRPLLTLLVMAAILAPTYGRILFYTGNPVFPFFSGLFGSSPWDGGKMLGGATFPERAAGILTLPWDAIFHRRTTGSAPPLSPAFLLGIPLLLWGALRDERVRWPVLVTAVYSLIYLVLARDVRYLAAVLPALSVALGGTLSELLEAVPRLRQRAGVLAVVLSLGLFLPGWLYACFQIVLNGPVPLTREARDTYLAGQLTSYSAFAWLNRTHGSDYTVYALYAENMVYFADGRFLGDAIGPANFFRVIPLLGHPGALDRELERLGAEYLLIDHDKGRGLPDTPEARRLFVPVFESAYTVLYRRARG